MKKLNKKGQIIENIGGIAIGIGTIALLMVIVFLITSNVQTQTVDEISSTAHTNYAVAFTNESAFHVGTCAGGLICTALMNVTGTSAVNIEIGTANYTCGDIDITPTIIGVDAPGTLYLNYSCQDQSVAYNATVEMTNNTYNIVGWIGLVVIILIGILILGLIKQIRQ